jgi:acetyltransferase-like isoleucine patch superfamily enzyme
VGDHPEAQSDPVKIGSDVWIGFGAVVLSGLSIGDSAIVAAGSVVIADVPENGVVAGSPARLVGRRFTDDEFRQHWIELKRLGFRPQAEFE